LVRLRQLPFLLAPVKQAASRYAALVIDANSKAGVEPIASHLFEEVSHGLWRKSPVSVRRCECEHLTDLLVARSEPIVHA
jgi:hypothetical protein